MIVYIAAACGGFLVVALLASDWETAAAMIFDLLCASLFIGATITALVALPKVRSSIPGRRSLRPKGTAIADPSSGTGISAGRRQPVAK